MTNKDFTHLSPEGKPQMVDVSAKDVTRRKAVASAIIAPGPAILEHFKEGEIVTKKGPVFQTAVIAGVMGAKKTSELIPFCHPVALEDCQLDIRLTGDRITIRSEATTTGKTGVEMEALTAASVAALTIYDMCKALSHDIIIEEIRLEEKTGGKEDFKRS